MCKREEEGQGEREREPHCTASPRGERKPKESLLFTPILIYMMSHIFISLWDLPRRAPRWRFMASFFLCRFTFWFHELACEFSARGDQDSKSSERGSTTLYFSWVPLSLATFYFCWLLSGLAFDEPIMLFAFSGQKPSCLQLSGCFAMSFLLLLTQTSPAQRLSL